MVPWAGAVWQVTIATTLCILYPKTYNTTHEWLDKEPEA